MFSFLGSAIKKIAAASLLAGACLVLPGAKTENLSFLHGIDVSRYQAEVNWEHVKESNIAFAFIKATEGNFLKDRYFARNWEYSRQHGIKRGAYHFFLPWVPAENQLEHFKQTVTLEPGDLAPVLDVETIAKDIPDADLRANIRQWLVGAEKHYGVKPIIYTYQAYYDRKLKGHFPDYHFWIARYQNMEPNVHPTDKMAFWQYSEKGIVKGVSSPVDVNWFYGDHTALSKYCVPQPKQEPEETLAQAETF